MAGEAAENTPGQAGAGPDPGAGPCASVAWLMRFADPGVPSRGALRAFLGAARRTALLPGFRSWQTFRALDATNAVFVLLEFDSPAALRAALDAHLAGASSLALTHRVHAEDPVVLTSTFDRSLAADAAAAALLRVARAPDPRRGPAGAADRASSMRSLAAPGTLRVHGARSADGTLAACRVDFDSEDAIWHFLQSPWRSEWSRRSTACAEEETWALNLPRLEIPAPRPEQEGARRSFAESFFVQLDLSEDGRSAAIRLEGVPGRAACERTERFCAHLLESGCRSLRVDISGLCALPSGVLGMLARTAGAVRRAGGEFVLLDNAARVRRLTRAKGLESAVAL